MSKRYPHKVNSNSYHKYNNMPHNGNNIPSTNIWDGIGNLLNILEGLGSVTNSGLQSLYFDANMSELTDEYVITVQLSGFDSSDVNIELKGNYLTVSANKKAQNNIKGAYYTGYGFSLQTYSRTFYVQDVAVDKISSKYANGILLLRLPRVKPIVQGNQNKQI